MAERAHPEGYGFKAVVLELLNIRKNRYKQNLIDRYTFCNSYIKNKDVLDVPCGMGWGTSLLKGYSSVHGMDISEEAIAEAKRRYPAISFQVGDMRDLNYENHSFDVVICLEGLEHITYISGQKFLSEAIRVLRKDGIMILSCPLLKEGKYHSGNIYHLCEYDEDELMLSLRESGFEAQESEYLDCSDGSRIILLVLKKSSCTK